MSAPASAEQLTKRRGATVRRLALLGLVGAGALVGLARLSGARDEAAAGPRLLPVSTLAIEPVTSFSRTRAFTGVLRPRRAVELGFERAGEVVEVTAQEGARLPAGAAVARLDRRRLEAERAALRARRAQAAARLCELRAGPREETLAAARAEVRALAAQVARLGSQRDRREKLLARGVITPEERDEVAYGLKTEEARLEAARRRLDELEAGTRAERLTAQEAELRRLDAELERLAIELEESVLTAPFAARVAAVRVDAGSVLQPGAPVVRLVEDRALEAWVGVPVGTGDPRPGQAYRLEVNGRGVPARLRDLLPELDEATRTATWLLEVEPEAAEGLLVGQVCRLILSERRSAEGFWLPLTALARGEREVWSCLAVVDGEDGHRVVERRVVEPLHIEAERALVRGTLEPGARVVAEGTHRLVPGQRVDAAAPTADEPTALRPLAAQPRGERAEVRR